MPIGFGHKPTSHSSQAPEMDTEKKQQQQQQKTKQNVPRTHDPKMKTHMWTWYGFMDVIHHVFKYKHSTQPKPTRHRITQYKLEQK